MPERKNLVLIMIDTLRPDHLGCYGYARNTSPHIDAVAGQGVLFTNFFSVAPWTNPSLATMFTGLYPQELFAPAPHEEAMWQVLNSPVKTLAEVLKENGYKTFALVDHPGIIKKLRFNQGFDKFVNFCEKAEKPTGSNPRIILRELSKQLHRTAQDPFFLFIHLVYPHSPYKPPTPYHEMFGEGFKVPGPEEKQGVINMYDAAIRYTDDVVGNILDALKTRGFLEKTYIVIVSDHGEGFWEHGLSEHGNSLHGELLRIPLVIRPPGGEEPKKVEELRSLIDLYPTLLSLLGVDKKPKSNGKDLSSLIRPGTGSEPPREDIVFSESAHSKCIYGLSGQTSNYKLIYTPPGPVTDYEAAMKQMSAGRFTAFYDLVNDPSETRDLQVSQQGVLQEMGAKLLRHKAIVDRKRMSVSQEKAQFVGNVKDQLRSLGYL